MPEPTGSSSPRPRWGESASADGADPGTDPGRPHPYESLYRGHASGAPGDVRPTPRHYIPSSSRPDGAEAGYGWLYREADPPSPPSPPIAFAPAPLAAAVPEPRRRSRRPLVVVIVLLVCVAMGIAYALPYGGGVGSADPAASPAASTSNAGTSSTPYAGAVARLAPVQATADCQAPAATDDGGSRVAYGPGNLSDQQSTTAWRCDGAGLGHQLTFTFPPGSRVAEVGLINGYPKVDPTSGAERYGEYRRITAVTWTFADGMTLRQPLTDGDSAVQTLRIPVQTGDRVTLTIDATTKPGWTAKSRDAVLIAEVAFGAPA